MAQSEALQNLEKRVYTSFHDDGLIDIFLGIFFAIDGILMLTDNAAFVGITVLLLFMVPPMKNLLTVPRIGTVKFSRPRQTRLAKTYILTLVLGLLVFLIFIIYQPGTGIREWVREYFDLVFGGLFIIFAGIAATLTNQKRFVAYTALVAIIFTSGHFVGWSFPTSLIILGTIVSGTGFGYLIKFLRDHPKPNPAS